MKKFLFASAVILSFVAQVKAEFIILDGVLDETPNKSYRAAGGGVRVSFSDNGACSYTSSQIEAADKTKYKKKSYEYLEDFKDFGEGRKCSWTTDEHVEANYNIDPTSTELTIWVDFIGDIVENHYASIKEVITRNPKNPLDYTFRVAVTEYTPGAEGKLGTAKAEIRLLEPK